MDLDNGDYNVEEPHEIISAARLRDEVQAMAQREQASYCRVLSLAPVSYSATYITDFCSHEP